MKHNSTTADQNAPFNEAETTNQAEVVRKLLVPSLHGKQLTINIAEIFKQGDTEFVSKAKAEALSFLLNEYEMGTQVHFFNINSLSDASCSHINYLTSSLDNVYTIAAFSTDTKPILISTGDVESDLEEISVSNTDTASKKTKLTELDIALNKISGRNALLHLLEMPVSTYDHLWYQLWSARFSDYSLYEDPSSYIGSLALFTQNTVPPFDLINAYTIKMGDRYLIELFEFLKKNQSFFMGRLSVFPYKTFTIVPVDVSIPHETFSEYLRLLVAYLEGKNYFPFKKICLESLLQNYISHHAVKAAV